MAANWWASPSNIKTVLEHPARALLSKQGQTAASTPKALSRETDALLRGHKPNEE
jgi:hypothetical protein